jgi:hypothetical protein
VKLGVDEKEAVGSEVNKAEMFFLVKFGCVYLILKQDVKGGGEAEKK